MPTLEAVIKLCKHSPNMMLNIELKGPESPEWAVKYDCNMAASKVIELIEKYSIDLKVMISSFGPRILDAVIKASPVNRRFLIQKLIWTEGNKTQWDTFNTEHPNIGCSYQLEELNA